MGRAEFKTELRHVAGGSYWLCQDSFSKALDLPFTSKDQEWLDVPSSAHRRIPLNTRSPRKFEITTW